jgi:hypothetical protein
MLPPHATQAVSQLTSTVYTFVGLMLLSAFVALLAARSFGGRSAAARQTIFSVVSFISLCCTAAYIVTRNG